MPVLKPRERSVYFRISEDEFHQFVSVCEQEGARSVSDLARSAVQRLITDCHRQREDQELMPRLQVLETLIANLTGQLQVLTELLQSQPVASAALSNGSGEGHAAAVNSVDRG